jgi:hypothetical protein
MYEYGFLSKLDMSISQLSMYLPSRELYPKAHFVDWNNWLNVCLYMMHVCTLELMNSRGIKNMNNFLSSNQIVTFY